MLVLEKKSVGGYDYKDITLYVPITGAVNLDGTGTMVIADANVKTGAKIFITYNVHYGGAASPLLAASTAAIVGGVSFELKSTPTDVSSVNYLIINP